MSLAHGFDGTKNEITHIQLPNGQELPEFKNYKVSGFEECRFIVGIVERSYNAGVVAEGERLSSLINRTIYKS
jgi:hypothetical protein